MVIDTMDQPFDSIVRLHAVRRRRRRAVTIAALGTAFLASTAAWLATSGVLSTNIQPPTGTGANGQIATVDASTLSGQIQSTGHLTAGVPVSRLTVARGWIANSAAHRNVQLSVVWTNAVQATLHGNDVIAVGVGYPVAESTGTCSTGYYVADTAISSGGGVTGVCVAVDTAATGKNVDTANDGQQGMTVLWKSLPGGTLQPGTAPPSTVGLCTTTPGAWCQPHGVGDQTGGDTTNRTLYLIAQVVNNGGNVPPGQQPSPGSFKFFVHAKATG